MHGAAGAEEHPQGRVQRPVHSLPGQGDRAIRVSSLCIGGVLLCLDSLYFRLVVISPMFASIVDIPNAVDTKVDRYSLSHALPRFGVFCSALLFLCLITKHHATLYDTVSIHPNISLRTHKLLGPTPRTR